MIKWKKQAWLYVTSRSNLLTHERAFIQSGTSKFVLKSINWLKTIYKDTTNKCTEYFFLNSPQRHSNEVLVVVKLVMLQNMLNARAPPCRRVCAIGSPRSDCWVELLPSSWWETCFHFAAHHSELCGPWAASQTADTPRVSSVELN